MQSIGLRFLINNSNFNTCLKLVRNQFIPNVRCFSVYDNEVKKLKNNKKNQFNKVKTKIKIKKLIVKQKIDNLKENIFTIPNGLTVFRICLTPFLCGFILNGNNILALSTFFFAGITDLLDGYIARNFSNQSSKLGSMLDPIADKFLIASTFIILTYINKIPLYLTILIIVRDLILIGCGTYIRYLSIPKPFNFKNFFDLNLATVEISPTFLSKLNTTLQLLFVSYILFSQVLKLQDENYFHYLCSITASSTVLSGLSYFLTKNTYKFFKK